MLLLRCIGGVVLDFVGLGVQSRQSVTHRRRVPGLRLRTEVLRLEDIGLDFAFQMTLLSVRVVEVIIDVGDGCHRLVLGHFGYFDQPSLVRALHCW